MLILLKKYARIISAHDLMMATARMRKDGEYVQANYREKFLKIYIKYFILRMKEVLDYTEHDNSKIDKQTYDDSFYLFEKTFEKERSDNFNVTDDKFPLIYVITSITGRTYTSCWK